MLPFASFLPCPCVTPFAPVKRNQLCGDGEIRSLAVQSLGPAHRVLAHFTAGTLSVWDLR
jgi:hypothetical protein